MEERKIDSSLCRPDTLAFSPNAVFNFAYIVTENQ
jgi:hypothetical protein